MSNDLSRLTDEQLIKLMQRNQEVQKRNPPSSVEWKLASKVINACAAENARRHAKAEGK